MPTYRDKFYDLVYEPDKGLVTTVFKDGTTCPVHTNIDHDYHAEKFNMVGSQISDKEYNLLHEIAHHEVGKVHGYDFCKIIDNTAKGIPPEMWVGEATELLEWEITAISYFAFKVPMRDSGEWGAIMNLAKHTNVYELADKIVNIWLELTEQ